MAYEKHTWVCGETITAESLNHIENGIEALEPMMLTYAGTTREEADAAIMGNGYLNATWQEINDAFRAGRRIVVITNPFLEETAATKVTMEVIGVSGTIGDAGLVDSKFSVQAAFGMNGGNPRLVAFRCDNATDRPFINFGSIIA